MNYLNIWFKTISGRLGSTCFLQDLKPQNFMKVKGKLKLIDFGISQMIQDEVTSMIIQQPEGTPNYIAPEVCAPRVRTAFIRVFFSFLIIFFFA